MAQEHPEYNYDTDVAEATKIADALKADGWTLPAILTDTGIHRSILQKDLQKDNERWNATVKSASELQTRLFCFRR